MDRKTYIETVLSALRHVTRREREAIRAEIDGHIEDHMADLLELDYPPELAEERTLSAIGDPAEVGRELNKQYPLRWLTVRWFAVSLDHSGCFAPAAQRRRCGSVPFDRRPGADRSRSVPPL